uniref:Uncharacterized protein n=1 Tax=Anguilla anguilla TaxID=7936 RepID=A0A0E9W1V6_ANGAN
MFILTWVFSLHLLVCFCCLCITHPTINVHRVALRTR